MRFEMSKRGTYFAARDRANPLFRELRKEEMATGGTEGTLVLDFSGVTHVSDSFARRFVNRVCDERAEAGRKVEIEGACLEVEKTIAWARTKRKGPGGVSLAA